MSTGGMLLSWSLRWMPSTSNALLSGSAGACAGTRQAAISNSSAHVQLRLIVTGSGHPCIIPAAKIRANSVPAKEPTLSAH